MNYITKHWRGELSLPISFWVNNVLLSCLLGTVAIGTIYILRDIVSSAFIVNYLLFLIPFCDILVFPWQAVGAWRSSNRYHQSGGKRRNVVLAKVTILLLIAWTIYDLPKVAALCYNLYKFAYGKNNFGGYSITRSKNGEALKITGFFGFGIYDEVREYLKENPQTKEIVLDSFGGSLYEGRKLKELILKNELNTHVLKHCYSACTIPFMAGKVRHIGPEAKLGFHAYSYLLDPLRNTPYDFSFEQEKELDFFRQQGASEAFLEKMYQAKGQNIWIPSQHELFDSGIVHRLSPMNEKK